MSETTTTETGTTTPLSSTTTDTGGAEKPFYETFAKEAVRTSPAVQRYKTVEDLAEGYVSLEKRFGIEPERRLDLPNSPDDKEGWAAVWKKLGAPDKAEGYAFELAKDASDADKALVSDFQKTAHDMGMPKAMAEGAMKWWDGQVKAAVDAQAAAFESARATGEAALRKEWGEAFDQRGREIGKLLADYATPTLKAELDGKLGNHPELSMFFGKLIDRMAEGGATPRSGEAAGDVGKLTPAQAAGEARKMEAHPAFRDKSHAEHNAIVAKRSEYLAQAS